MDNIVDPIHNFDFSQLTLGNPTSIQGGACFTKLFYGGKPLYIQTPKSLTKQGFVKNAKKYYVELMFDANDEKYFHWLENLETRCQQLIFENRETWFQNQLDLTDIESAFAATTRPYKSCKYYLLRVNAKMNYSTNLPLVKIYNENETPLNMEDVTSEVNVISILEIQGVKFTSRNFQIEMEVKQMMTLNTEVFFDNCLIKAVPNKSNSLVESIKEPQTLQYTDVTQHQIEEVKQEDSQEENILEKEDQEDKGDQDQEEKEKEQYQETVLDSLENQHSQEQAFDELKEFDITDISTLESITLKKPNQVYYELYKEARRKAKIAKKEAILAFLEAKNIKKTYMLETFDDSDNDSDNDSDMDNISEASLEDKENEIQE
jgi:hypothetical protein